MLAPCSWLMTACPLLPLKPEIHLRRPTVSRGTMRREMLTRLISLLTSISCCVVLTLLGGTVSLGPQLVMSLVTRRPASRAWHHGGMRIQLANSFSAFRCLKPFFRDLSFCLGFDYCFNPKLHQYNLICPFQYCIELVCVRIKTAVWLYEAASYWADPGIIM